MMRTKKLSFEDGKTSCEIYGLDFTKDELFSLLREKGELHKNIYHMYEALDEEMIYEEYYVGASKEEIIDMFEVTPNSRSGGFQQKKFYLLQRKLFIKRFDEVLVKLIDFTHYNMHLEDRILHTHNFLLYETFAAPAFAKPKEVYKIIEENNNLMQLLYSNIAQGRWLDNEKINFLEIWGVLLDDVYLLLGIHIEQVLNEHKKYSDHKYDELNEYDHEEPDNGLISFDMLTQEDIILLQQVLEDIQSKERY